MIAQVAMVNLLLVLICYCGYSTKVHNVKLCMRVSAVHIEYCCCIQLYLKNETLHQHSC